MVNIKVEKQTNGETKVKIDNVCEVTFNNEELVMKFLESILINHGLGY